MTPRIASRVFGVLLCSAALGCSGDTSSPTEITIEVTSDLSAPTEIDRVDIDVTNLKQPVHASADLTKKDLPRHLTLVHDGGPLGPVTITVTGFLDNARLIERKVELSFSLRTSKALSVRLERECLHNFCTDDTTCVQGKCHTYADVEGGAGKGGEGGTSAGAGGMTGGHDPDGSGGTGTGGAGGSGTGGMGSGGTGGTGTGGSPPVNQPPQCTIKAPADGSTLSHGLDVHLEGMCTDPEGGTIGPTELHWSSTHDTSLGNGPMLMLDPIPLGSETFELCADDPDDANLQGCAQATVDVVEPDPPSVTIDAIQQGLNFASPYSSAKSIQLLSTVTGQELTLEWSDTFVGIFDTKADASLRAPEIGVHTVRLTAKDNVDQSDFKETSFTVVSPDMSSLVQTFTSVSTALGGAVRVLAVDSGSQALAYGPGGLKRFDAADISATPADAMIDQSGLTAAVTALLIAENVGLIYIGTDSGLLVCQYTKNMPIDQTMCTTYTGFGALSNEITAVARASANGSDRLLIGTATGLFVATDPAVPNVGNAGLWSNERISAIVALGNSFWFTSTTSGLHYYDTVSGMVYAQPGAPSQQLSALAKDAAGALWAGSDNGFGRLDADQTWTLLNTGSPPPPGLISDTVQAVATTHVTIGGSMRDVVWAGTSAGVARYDRSVPSFMALTDADGLPSTNVYATALLPNGSKLFGTAAGVALYTGH
jgi:hypothetical protein